MFNIEYCFVAKSFRRDFAAKSPVISARQNPPLKRTQRLYVVVLLGSSPVEEHRALEIINFFYFSFTHYHFSDQETSNRAFYCNKSVGFLHLQRKLNPC